MRAFYADPQSIDANSLDDSAILVVEQASGRAWASPIGYVRDVDKATIHDICWAINREENNYGEAKVIIEAEGWCIYDDSE